MNVTAEPLAEISKSDESVPPPLSTQEINQENVHSIPSLTPPLPTSEPGRPRITPKTVKLTDLLRTDKKEDEKLAAAEKVMNAPYTEQQLRDAWDEFAGKRKHLQAEFQMLSQRYEVKDDQITVTLLSPVHEMMLNNIKIELAAFLREKLRNTAIAITGALTTSDDKKVIYTNRDKFDYLAEKNPMLRELKERLGLDTDF